MNRVSPLALAAFALFVIPPLPSGQWFQLTAAEPRLVSDAFASQVMIRRDTYGVAHILAPTESAVIFGQGYAVAEDHVLALARLFLKARGEEAAYFGEQFADSDFAVKEFHMHEGAESGYAKSPPQVQMLLDAYAAGYNRYLEKHRRDLPDWVKPVTGIDVLAHVRRVLIMEFAMDLRQMDVIGGKTAQQAPADALDVRLGSNMWAIGKGRSASGKGILLANPHLNWSGSHLFHEVHLTVPGKINLSGATLIGIPVVAIGFNENLGWSHTVNLHDSDDVYALTLDPQDEHRYIYEGRSLPLRREQITFQVKTAQGLTTRTKEVAWSHYGPVLKRDQNVAYAFKSANLDEYRFLEQWHGMATSKNLDEFRRALDLQALPMFNIAYADKDGNVFYIFNGRFPDRPAGYDWSGVVPGDTSATEWSAILPEARLPYLINPPGSYVQNCNSSPWYTNLRAIIDRKKYPADLTPNLNDLRSQLSLEMLEGHPRISLQEVLRYKFNTKLLLADRVKGALIRSARGRTVEDVHLDEAVKVLRTWDNTVSRESRGAMLFVTFWNEYRTSAKPVFHVAWNERRPASTPYGIGDSQKALEALAAAVKEMKQMYDALEIPWGDIHRLRRGSLDAAIGGFTGDFGGFRVVRYVPDKDGKYLAVGGDSYVLAMEFTTPPTAYSVTAYSTTDDPRSPHHTDQSALFADQQWKRAWFTEEDVAKHTERSYHPE